MSKVTLAGAGCSKEDISLRALEKVKNADVILYDSLIDPEILSECKSDCKLIYVGKRGGKKSKTQEEINALLLDCAKKYKNVLRLKGGDPLLFSRGGEELEFLTRNHVETEVVPGISSISSGAAKFHLPLTHRKLSHSLLIINGHDLDQINFKSLAKYDGTLCILMGKHNIEEISKRLIQNGMKSDTPACYLSNIDRKDEEIVFKKLGALKEENLKTPGIILIGKILKNPNQFNFIPQDETVLLLRLDEEDHLEDELLKKYYTVHTYPLIIIVGIENLKIPLEADIIVFTSKNSVTKFFEYLLNNQIDIRRLAQKKFCVIGPGTAERLKSYGIIADIMPEVYSSKGIYKALKPILKKDDKVLLLRSDRADDTLKNKLSELCKVEQIICYRIKPVGTSSDLNDIIENENVKKVILTSQFIARRFLELVDSKNLSGIDLISIGEETSKVLEPYDYVEARESSVAGLLELV